MNNFDIKNMPNKLEELEDILNLLKKSSDRLFFYRVCEFSNFISKEKEIQKLLNMNTKSIEAKADSFFLKNNYIEELPKDRDSEISFVLTHLCLLGIALNINSEIGNGIIANIIIELVKNVVPVVIKRVKNVYNQIIRNKGLEENEYVCNYLESDGRCKLYHKK